MSFLPYPPTNTTEAIQVFKQDVQIAHDVVHGGDTTDVATENGNVPSFSKLVKTLTDEVEAATGVDVSLRSDLASSNSTVLVGGAYAADVGKIAKFWTPIFVESFRQSGFSDSQTIQAALSFIDGMTTTGTRLIFQSGRKYTYNAEHSIKNINNMWIDLNGATLFRANGSTTSALLSADLTVSGGTTFTVDSVPSTWAVGEFLSAFTSDSDADCSRDRRRITSIVGNTVTIANAFSFTPSKTTLPAGTRIAKSFSCFAGRPSSADTSAYPLTQGNNRQIFISNGVIDGNRANQFNVSWRFIPEITLHSNGAVIEKMNFKNITTETVVGHGITVRDCVYEDIGGSVMHTSISDDTISQAGYSYFVGNTCKRTNLATNAKIGHSEGAITFSWNAGNFIVANNYFEDLTEAWLGGFGPSTGVNSDEFFIATGNIVKGAAGVMDFFSADIIGVNIFGNVLHNCGDSVDDTFTLNKSPNGSFHSNVLSGTTTAYQAQPKSLSRNHHIGFSSSIPQNIHLYRSLTNGPTFGVSNTAAGFWPTLPSKTTAFFEGSASDGINVAHISDGYTSNSVFTSARTSATAEWSYDHANKKMVMGTNISAGLIEFKTGTYTTRMRIADDGVDTPNFQGLYLGEKATDGSWRFSISGSNLLIERRIAGVWTTKSTITG